MTLCFTDTEAERALWRSVIQLNLTRSVRIILDALEAQLAQNTNHYVQSHSNAYTSTYHSSQPGPSSFHESRTLNNNDDNDPNNESMSFHPSTIPFSDHLLLVMRRLLPLRHLEALLMTKLAPPEEDEATRLLTYPPPVYDPSSPHSYPPTNGYDYGFSGSTNTGINGSSSSSHVYHPNSYSNGNGNGYSNGHRPSINSRSSQPQELFVRSNTAWKSHLSRTAPSPSSADISSPSSSTLIGSTSHNHKEKERAGGVLDSHDPTQIIHSCREDILDLWHEPVVREVLRRRKVRLEESPGLYVLLFPSPLSCSHSRHPSTLCVI